MRTFVGGKRIFFLSSINAVLIFALGVQVI